MAEAPPPSPEDDQTRTCCVCNQPKPLEEYCVLTRRLAKKYTYLCCRPCRRERTAKNMFGMSMQEVRDRWMKQNRLCDTCQTLMGPLVLSALWIDYSKRPGGIICHDCATPEDKEAVKRTFRALKEDVDAHCVKKRRAAREIS
jgi:hypothetical protein